MGRIGAIVVGLSCAFSMACGGGSSSSSNSSASGPSSGSSGSNVASASVSAGPNGNSANGLYTDVTVCAPGTSNCQTVSNVLVDIGSSGLRILSSVLTISLTQQTASNGSPTVECFPFVSGYTWGPVQTADVEIAGEKASSTPIQVIGTSTAVPSGCSSYGTETDTVDTLGANGILGIGLFAQDCSNGPCPSSVNIYYGCPSSTSCTAVTQSAAQQVLNPVSLFTADNNGVVIELPAVSGSEASVSGSLIFGIGTQSNNGLGGATVYTANDYGNFTTTFNGTSYSNSFIDSGSNAYFFPDSGIAQCASDSEAPGFYCPASMVNLSATNLGSNGSTGTVDFSVANATNLFSNGSDFAFSDLGGPVIGGPPEYFDWGLPFFYGRNVYTAIQGASTPGGEGPYWAY
ncbi:MAG: DUF3443 domain-containing protein [Candidatus Sulfotelmatobacter sp.]